MATSRVTGICPQPLPGSSLQVGVGLGPTVTATEPSPAQQSRLRDGASTGGTPSPMPVAGAAPLCASGSALPWPLSGAGQGATPLAEAGTRFLRCCHNLPGCLRPAGPGRCQAQTLGASAHLYIGQRSKCPVPGVARGTDLEKLGLEAPAEARGTHPAAGGGCPSLCCGHTYSTAAGWLPGLMNTQQVPP